jgi:hypothetical protein
MVVYMVAALSGGNECDAQGGLQTAQDRQVIKTERATGGVVRQRGRGVPGIRASMKFSRRKGKQAPLTKLTFTGW